MERRRGEGPRIGFIRGNGADDEGQGVALKAMAYSLRGWEAAEIGISGRTMRRRRKRYERDGFDGLYDYRKG